MYWHEIDKKYLTMNFHASHMSIKLIWRMNLLLRKITLVLSTPHACLFKSNQFRVSGGFYSSEARKRLRDKLLRKGFFFMEQISWEREISYYSLDVGIQMYVCDYNKFIVYVQWALFRFPHSQLDLIWFLTIRRKLLRNFYMVWNVVTVVEKLVIDCHWKADFL